MDDDEVRELLRFHEISEADHRILNPISDAKLMLLGEVCRLQAGQRHLDLACGKGEMLARWSERWRTEGVGVDISSVFLASARARAEELGVADRVRFVQAEAAEYLRGQDPADGYDLVSCIGATWIGGGLAGTLNLLRPWVRPSGLLLIGEPYWLREPSEQACEEMGIPRDGFASLGGTLDRFAAAGVELVELVLADPDSWDRYAAAQWWTTSGWLQAHPDDPLAPGMREFLERSRRSYLRYGRDHLGWGVFVLR